MRRLVLVLVLLAGCTASTAKTVTVLAAASLTEAFGDLGVADVAYSFAGSQQLVAQVEGGAPADVIATADTLAMERLVRAGLVAEPRDFARNRLAIAVERGNPHRIAVLADLGRTDLKVVLADPAVPAGRYAQQVLDRMGVWIRPVSLELDVKAAARKVADGEADAAIVYATDVAGSARIDLPDAANVDVRYPVAVVTATRHRAGAEAFVERLVGPAGRKALAGHGFLLP